MALEILEPPLIEYLEPPLIKKLLELQEKLIDIQAELVKAINHAPMIYKGKPNER